MNQTIYGDAPSKATVSWQSAFWAIVPGALNAMTEPPGEYTSPLHRISPIFCAFDSIMVLVRLVAYLIVGFPFRQATAKTYRDRLVRLSIEIGDEKQKNPFWFRWAIFTIGTLSQTVKLFAFDGLMWTKIWASCFTAFFVTSEILLVSSAPVRGRLGDEHAGNDENIYPLLASTDIPEGGGPQRTRVTDLRIEGKALSLEPYLQRFDKYLTFLNWILLFALLSWATHQLWASAFMFSEDMLDKPDFQYFFTLEIPLLFLTILLGPPSLIFQLLEYFKIIGNTESNFKITIIIIITLAGSLVWGCFAMLWVGGFILKEHTGLLVSVVGYLWEIFAFLLISFSLLVLALAYRHIGELVASASLLCVCFLWYCFRYNSEGTSKPKWTDVLG